MYVNTGDFVESCTAIAEHPDGRLEILRWQSTAAEREAAALADQRTSAAGGRLMRILIATDAWKPQVNGVVRSLESVAKALREFGAEFEFLTPQGFASIPLPTYGEIKLALATAGAVRNGWKARRSTISTSPPKAPWVSPRGAIASGPSVRSRRAITRAFRNISRRGRGLPESITYAVLRRFHNAGSGVMVSTSSIANDLAEPRLPAADALVARRRSQHLCAVQSLDRRPAAADFPLRRAARAREERREFSARSTCPDRK